MSRVPLAKSTNPDDKDIAARTASSRSALSIAARCGTRHAAKAVLIGAIPPVMLKSEKNPGGTPIEVFDGGRAALITNRAQLYRDVAADPFYGFNRPGATISQGTIDNEWRGRGQGAL